MKKADMLSMLSERHKTNRERIRCYVKQENVDGSPVSSGHAATALSNARREQLIVELLMEVVAQSSGDIRLSERAEQGFQKLTMPLERHFNKDGTKRNC